MFSKHSLTIFWISLYWISKYIFVLCILHSLYFACILGTLYVCALYVHCTYPLFISDFINLDLLSFISLDKGVLIIFIFSKNNSLIDSLYYSFSPYFINFFPGPLLFLSFSSLKFVLFSLRP